MVEAAEKFVVALAAKDTDALLGLFAPTLVFRGMTPGRFWEATTPTEVVHDVLYHWFEPQDVVEAVDRVEHGAVADRGRVDYLFRARTPDGMHAVEQRAYVDLDDDGRIARMHVMCSGFRALD